jgi:hypothetical protein
MTLVGPAMIRAYEMESKEAVYPRVLIDPIVLEVAKRYRSSDHTPEEEADYVRSFMTEDPTDGRFYYDSVSWDSVISHAGGEAHLYGDYLTALGAMIERGLRHPSAGVREKYLWLHPQYLAAVDDLIGVPADAEFRTENPGLCEEAETRPRLEDLVAEARARVASERA